MKKIIYVMAFIISILAFSGCAHEHSFREANCTEPKTCMECGETEGVALGHTWKEATCTEPKTCSNCKTTEGTSTGHNWKNATCTEPKTCSNCKTTEGTSLGHNMSGGFCTRCNYTSLQISNVLSAPIEDGQSIEILSQDLYVYSGKNFASYYNSANGLYLAWGATNTSSKTIKYLTFTAEFYNSVGDPAKDSITGKTSTTIRLIGPINAGESLYYRKIIGYSTSCSSIKITNITIEYMDGTKITGTYNYSTHHKSATSRAPEMYVTGYIK